LHDSVGALLFAIQAGVHELSQALKDDGALQAKAETIEAHAIEATRALRESLLAMSQPPTERALEVELRRDCAAFEQRTGIRTSFVVLDHPDRELDCARAEALVGAAREALLNVEKHAGAANVVVTLSCAQATLQLTVTDDGDGEDERHSLAGLGLSEQQRRFARLGGRVAFEPLEDRGGVFRAQLPLRSR
jgi:signal transduction histidine kinase